MRDETSDYLTQSVLAPELGKKGTGDMAYNEKESHGQSENMNDSGNGVHETPQPTPTAADQPAETQPERPKAEPSQREHAVSPDAPDEVKTTIAALVEAFPSLKPFHKEDDWTEVVVPAALLKDVARFVRDDERLKLNFLSSLSGVDYRDAGLQVVYHLISIPAGRPKLIMKVNAEGGRDNAHVPSVVDIWPTANWHEREAWDLLGIRFDGHPNLKRILLREDWIGHPLRKDYVDSRPPRERQYKETWAPPSDRGVRHDES